MEAVLHEIRPQHCLSSHPTRAYDKASSDLNGNRVLRVFRNPHPVIFLFLKEL